MKKRSFLKGLFGLAVVSVAPSILNAMPTDKKLTIVEMYKRMKSILRQKGLEYPYPMGAAPNPINNLAHAKEITLGDMQYKSIESVRYIETESSHNYFAVMHNNAAKDYIKSGLPVFRPVASYGKEVNFVGEIGRVEGPIRRFDRTYQQVIKGKGLRY